MLLFSALSPPTSRSPSHTCAAGVAVEIDIFAVLKVSRSKFHTCSPERSLATLLTQEGIESHDILGRKPKDTASYWVAIPLGQDLLTGFDEAKRQEAQQILNRLFCRNHIGKVMIEAKPNRTELEELSGWISQHKGHQPANGLHTGAVGSRTPVDEGRPRWGEA